MYVVETKTLSKDIKFPLGYQVSIMRKKNWICISIDLKRVKSSIDENLIDNSFSMS